MRRQRQGGAGGERPRGEDDVGRGLQVYRRGVQPDRVLPGGVHRPRGHLHAAARRHDRVGASRVALGAKVEAQG